MIRLSNKQQRILQLARDGKNVVEISEAVGLKRDGVWHHVARMRELGFDVVVVPVKQGGGPTRTQLYEPCPLMIWWECYFIRNGWGRVERASRPCNGTAPIEYEVPLAYGIEIDEGMIDDDQI